MGEVNNREPAGDPQRHAKRPPEHLCQLDGSAGVGVSGAGTGAKPCSEQDLNQLREAAGRSSAGVEQTCQVSVRETLASEQGGELLANYSRVLAADFAQRFKDDLVDTVAEPMVAQPGKHTSRRCRVAPGAEGGEQRAFGL